MIRISAEFVLNEQNGIFIGIFMALPLIMRSCKNTESSSDSPIIKVFVNTTAIFFHKTTPQETVKYEDYL